VGGAGGLQIVEYGTLNQKKTRAPSARPNYISQDDDEDQLRGYNTNEHHAGGNVGVHRHHQTLLNYREKTRVCPNDKKYRHKRWLFNPNDLAL
jgi:hypothetical protein